VREQDVIALCSVHLRYLRLDVVVGWIQSRQCNNYTF